MNRVLGVLMLVFVSMASPLHVGGQASPTEIATFKKLAAQGDRGGQYALGYLYTIGSGVPTNKAEGVKWYRLAAAQGNADAQFNLGLLYANGEGVPENDAEAAKWYRLAAAQGNADREHAAILRS